MVLNVGIFVLYIVFFYSVLLIKSSNLSIRSKPFEMCIIRKQFVFVLTLFSNGFIIPTLEQHLVSITLINSNV